MPSAAPAPVRTLIVAASARRRVTLEAWLQSAVPIKVIGALSSIAAARSYLEDRHCDAVLFDLQTDAADEDSESLFDACQRNPSAIILLVDDVEPSSITHLLDSGASAILQRNSSREQIAAAIWGAAEELIVLSAETVRDLVAEGRTIPAEHEPLIEELTPREAEILGMVAAGLGNREIAMRLEISEHTVKFHVSSILGKLGAASRTEAVAQGIKRGLVLL